MKVDGISEIMVKYPWLITENTNISKLPKGWLDLLENFCSNITYLSKWSDTNIQLTEIKEKDDGLKVRYILCNLVGDKTLEEINALHNIVMHLSFDLESNSRQVDIKTGEYTGRD